MKKRSDEKRKNFECLEEKGKDNGKKGEKEGKNAS